MDHPFRKRLRRRLHYGDGSNLGTPSLPMTELSVEYFKDSVSQKLGHIEMDTASDVIRQNQVSPSSLVTSMMYAKRLRKRNQEYLGSMSSSDVFFISMMMASKYMYDEGVDEEVFNDEWAETVNMETTEVNSMEMDFLKAIDWNLFVRPEEFEETLDAIEKRLALQEGLKRGWFTYSELSVLADLGLWKNVGWDCCKLSGILMSAYATALVSMLGSTLVAVTLAAPLSTAAVALMTPAMTFPSWSTLRPSASPAWTENSSLLATGDFLDDHSLLAQVPDFLENEVNKTASLVGSSGHRLGGGLRVIEEEEILVNKASSSHQSLEESPLEASLNENEETDDEKPELSDPPPNPEPASRPNLAWSVLFLDSLLSQLCSVVTTPRTKHPPSSSRSGCCRDGPTVQARKDNNWKMSGNNRLDSKDTENSNDLTGPPLCATNDGGNNRCSLRGSPSGQVGSGHILWSDSLTVDSTQSLSGQKLRQKANTHLSSHNQQTTDPTQPCHKWAWKEEPTNHRPDFPNSQDHLSPCSDRLPPHHKVNGPGWMEESWPPPVESFLSDTDVPPPVLSMSLVQPPGFHTSISLVLQAA